MGRDRRRRGDTRQSRPRGASRQAERDPLARRRYFNPRRRQARPYFQSRARRLSGNAGGKCHRDGEGGARAERAMSAAPRYDAVLLLAFGGPGGPEEIRRFLDRVLAGRPAPPARFEEVARHYEAVGGRSPLPDITFAQAGAVADLLGDSGVKLPVYVGFRHSSPYIVE